MAPPALVPAPVPEVPMVEKLLQRLVEEMQIRQPAPVVASEPVGFESLLRSLLSGQLAPVQQPRQGSFRRNGNAVVCFSCGKAGHSARISSKVRPQDPGRGAARIAVPREAVDLEMRSAFMSSVVEPQSAPLRISVVLVEEAEVRGAECLVSAPVDKVLRLLAGVTCPASGTVCEDCVVMPGVVGTVVPV